MVRSVRHVGLVGVVLRRCWRRMVLAALPAPAVRSVRHVGFAGRLLSKAARLPRTVQQAPRPAN